MGQSSGGLCCGCHSPGGRCCAGHASAGTALESRPLVFPIWKIATATPTAPSPMSTQTHQAGVSLEWLAVGVVVTTDVVLFVTV